MRDLAAQSGRMRAIKPRSFCDSREKFAKMSCDVVRFRVKVRPAFGCSITRSITELNSDSHSRRFTASNQEPLGTETHGSCGKVSLPKSVSAGSTQACSGLRHPHPDLSADRSRLAIIASASPRPPRAEFISVSGQRTDRSALGSDMRHSKRISGHAAATVPPHAPMNRSARRDCGGRVCLSTILS